MRHTVGIRGFVRFEDLRYCFILAATLIFVSSSGTAVSEENMNEPQYDNQEDVYLISNITELNWIRNAPKEDYKLVDDINATPTKNWNNGKGWKPIGEQNYEFYGTLNGNSYSINNLTINRTDGNNIGLIAITGDNSFIKNLKLSGAYIKAGDNAGILIGNNLGKISNVDVSGVITAHGYNIGGLLGHNDYDSGEIVDVDADVMINQSINGEETQYVSNVGGITGYNEGGSLINSSATGKINISGDRAGGLVGVSRYDYIRNSNSSVDVYGNNLIGGLAGKVEYGRIETSYSTGNVTGDEEIGGLVGIVNNPSGLIENSYSTSKVNGNRSVGGLVGYNDGEIIRSYSIGNVTGDTYEGGLVGWNVGTVEESFWNTQKSGLTESDGGVGKKTSKMKNFWTFKHSPNLEDEYYESGEPVDVTLKKDNDRDIALNTEDNSFKLVKVNESDEDGTDDEAIINVDGTNKTITESSNITVSGTDIGLRHVSDYQDPSEADLEFYVDNLWDLKNISSFKDVNQSYEWNIVDGESYPFLSWEEKEEGNQSVTIKVEDDLGNSVENALVRIDGEYKETDSNGEVRFEDLYEAEYTAIADENGYRENSTNFDLTQDGQTEKVVIEKIKSDFNITDLSLNASRLDENEKFAINVTVKNNGSEKGKRTLHLVINGVVEEEKIELDSGESKVLEFTSFEEDEVKNIIYAGIFEVTRKENISVGPKKYNLEIESSEGGSTYPSSGNYTYEEGKSLTIRASKELGWNFSSWVGDVSKESKEITLTMDEDKEIKPNFSKSIAVDIALGGRPGDGRYLVEGEAREYDFEIVNKKQTNITDNLTVELGGRELSNINRSIELNSTSTYDSRDYEGLEIQAISGDAAKDVELTVEYGGVKDSIEFKRIGAISRSINKGYNYFSFPGVLNKEYSVKDVIEAAEQFSVDRTIGDGVESIWTYKNGQWMNYYPSAPQNDFNSMEAGQGYIIDAKENFTTYPVVDTNLSRLESNTVVTPATHQITSGWNLIGSYWKNNLPANSTEAFNSMPENTVTQVLASDKDGAIGLKPLESGSITGGRAYWVSARENATYTKSVVN